MRKIKAYEISAETSPATTPATPTTGIASTPPTMGVVVGDIDSSDINMPRLNIVQGVGSLSELFSPGQVVMNQEIVLSNGTTPIELTVLAARKQFVENLAYDAESRPRVFDTLDEVHAAGGSINWIGNMRPSFVPVLHVNVLIKAPQGVEGSFPIHYNGEDYALGLRISREYRIGRIYDVLYYCRRWEGNSDAALDVEKVNANNLYKDRVRTWELEARVKLCARSKK